MGYRWNFGKEPVKLEKFCEWSTIKYDIISYFVTIDLQKRFFIKPAKSWPHWNKSALRKSYVAWWRNIDLQYFNKHFPHILSNTPLDFISDMGVTDHRPYDW